MSTLTRTGPRRLRQGKLAALLLMLPGLLSLPSTAGAHELKLDPQHVLVDPFDDNIIRTARLFNRAVVGVEIARNGGVLTDVILRAQGDIALLDGRLGAGVDVPFLHHTTGSIVGTVGSQPISSTGFGDVRLRAAGQALRHRGTVLTLLTIAMRVTFPSGTQSIEGIQQTRRYLVEPAVLASLTWRKLTFTTNQGVATAPVGGVGSTITSYASSYAASYGILGWLGASTGLDLAVPIRVAGASPTVYVTPAVSFFLPRNFHAGVGLRIGVAGAVVGSSGPDLAVMVRGGLEWDSFGSRPGQPPPLVAPPPLPMPPPAPTAAPPAPAPAPAPAPTDEVPGQGPPPGGAEPPPPTPPPIDEPDRPAPPPPPPPPPI